MIFIADTVLTFWQIFPKIRLAILHMRSDGFAVWTVQHLSLLLGHGCLHCIRHPIVAELVLMEDSGIFDGKEVTPATSGIDAGGPVCLKACELQHVRRPVSSGVGP